MPSASFAGNLLIETSGLYKPCTNQSQRGMVCFTLGYLVINPMSSIYTLIRHCLVMFLALAIISACSSSSNGDPVENDNPLSIVENPVDDVPGQPGPAPDPAPATPSEPSIPAEPSEPSEPSILIPPADNDSSLAQLLDGIHQQVGITLVDLNQRLNSGIMLTEQQNQCVGSFDPAIGESLTMISCDQPLATNDIAIYVESASFYASSVCQAGLLNGTGTDCVVRQARITVPTTFTLPDNTSVPQRPQPITGAEIFYAIDGTLLRVENNPSMLTGVFRCDYNLETAQAVTNNTAANCDAIISGIAARLNAT